MTKKRRSGGSDRNSNSNSKMQPGKLADPKPATPKSTRLSKVAVQKKKEEPGATANTEETPAEDPIDMEKVDPLLPPTHRNKDTCPCNRSSGGDWLIDCSKCSQNWHLHCVSLGGLSGKEIGKLTEYLCPFCYVAPIVTTSRKTEDICHSCRNTQTLREVNQDAEINATVHRMTSLNGQLSGMDIANLSSSLAKVEEYDLRMKHLIVGGQEALKEHVATQENLSKEMAGLKKELCSLKDSLKEIPETATTTEENPELLKTLRDIREILARPAPVTEIQNNAKDLPGNADLIKTLTDVKELLTSAKPGRQVSPRESIAEKKGKEAPILDHGQKCFTQVKENYISESESSKLCEFLDECQFEQEGGRKTLAFGAPYYYSGAKSHKAKPVPEVLEELFVMINKQQEEIYFAAYPDAKKYKRQAPVINSCLVNKFHGGGSHLAQHSDNESSVHPESSILTLSLGASCDVQFSAKSTQTDTEKLHASANSLYVMSRKSQEYFEHRIEPGSIDAPRYSLTFRSCRWQNRNSTCLIGDSNTGHLFFGEEEGRTFGDAMPGQRFWAPLIQDINPRVCSGYSKVVVMCGTNNLRTQDVRNKEDVERIGHQLDEKLKQIRQLNPSCKIYLCPVLPSRDYQLNLRIFDFCRMVKTYLVPSNQGVIYVNGFNGFLNNNNMLSDQYSRMRNKNGHPDILHLNRAGTKLLARLIKRTIPLRFEDIGLDRKVPQAVTPSESSSAADLVPRPPSIEGCQV